MAVSTATNLEDYSLLMLAIPVYLEVQLMMFKWVEHSDTHTHTHTEYSHSSLVPQNLPQAVLSIIWNQ